MSQNHGGIRGKVKDGKTGELLPGVNIVIKQLVKGASTDANGVYEILNLPEGVYKISASCIGYQPQKRKVRVNNTKLIIADFSLESYSENLNEIFISAKSEARKIQELAMPVSVITMKALQGTVSDVSGVLAKTAGIKIRASGGVGSATRMSVRGLEGKRIGIYLDDSPIGDQSDFVGINDIPIDLIERIEIYKGIVPARLGGSSIGGAVNIILKDYPPKYMDFSYSFQSFNTHKTSAVFKRNNEEKGIEYGIGGFYTTSDNDYTMELPLEPGVFIKRDHDKFKKFTVGAALTLKKTWFDEIKIEPAVVYTFKEIQGVLHNIQEAKSYANAFFLVNNNKKKNFFIEGLDLVMDNSYTYTIYSMQDKGMHRYNWDGSTYAPLTKYGGEIGTMPNDSHNRKHTFFQRSNLSYILNKTSLINFNSQYRYVFGNPEDKLKDKHLGYKTNFDTQMHSWITGLTYEYNSLNKKFTSSVAGKYYIYSIRTIYVPISDMNNKIDVNTEKKDYGFNLSNRYRFTPHFLTKLSLSYDVRLPSETELLGDGFLILPSTVLTPERNTSVNFGFMYDKTNAQQGRFQFEINGFYMQLDDMIRFTAVSTQGKYSNFGEMQTLGVETDVKWDATSFLYLWGNATYQNLIDTRKYEPGTTDPNSTKGKRMPNIPWLYANVGFELHKANVFGGSNQNTRLFADCSFVEEYLFDFDVSKFQYRKIPRSTTFNFGLEHSFNNNRVFFSMQANNLTNTKVISEFNRPLPGRNFGMKIRYVWK